MKTVSKGYEQNNNYVNQNNYSGFSNHEKNAHNSSSPSENNSVGAEQRKVHAAQGNSVFLNNQEYVSEEGNSDAFFVNEDSESDPDDAGLMHDATQSAFDTGLQSDLAKAMELLGE